MCRQVKSIAIGFRFRGSGVRISPSAPSKINHLASVFHRLASQISGVGKRMGSDRTRRKEPEPNFTPEPLDPTNHPD